VLYTSNATNRCVQCNICVVQVRDYVYSYLGESRAANDFVSKFLERRSQLKAGAKAQGGAADKPAANKANSVRPMHCCILK
jgi:hypothetical protein